MDSNADDAIELRIGEELAVTLTGLGTAGYRWVPCLEGGPEIAEVSPSEESAAQPEGAVGTSADEVFTIRALRPGATRIRFEQRRPWEGDDSPPANERTIQLRIS